MGRRDQGLKKMGLKQYDPFFADESLTVTDGGQVVMDAIDADVLDAFRAHCVASDAAVFREACLPGGSSRPPERVARDYDDGDGSEGDIWNGALK
jgi:hypothetical protein